MVSILGFNSLLEMPDVIRAALKVFEVKGFQFSIGDADRMPLADLASTPSPVSILYWRCGAGATEGALTGRDPLFQFSIGDADKKLCSAPASLSAAPVSILYWRCPLLPSARLTTS